MLFDSFKLFILSVDLSLVKISPKSLTKCLVLIPLNLLLTFPILYKCFELFKLTKSVFELIFNVINLVPQLLYLSLAALSSIPKPTRLWLLLVQSIRE